MGKLFETVPTSLRSDTQELLKCLRCHTKFVTDAHSEENLIVNDEGRLVAKCPKCFVSEAVNKR